MKHVIPDSDLVAVKVQLTDSNGQPVPRALLQIDLETPKTATLTTTDFPHVEESILISSKVLMVKGEYTFSTVFPIRGNYQLNIRASADDADASPLFSSTTLSVSENPEKIRTLLFFISGLITIGIVSGVVIGRGAKSQIAKAGMIIVAIWSSELIMPAKAAAHAPDANTKSPGLPQEVSASSGAYRITVYLDTASPRVGDLSDFRGKLTDIEGQLKPAKFTLRFVQLEHNQIVFETTITSATGEFDWHGQFFDGADHRVELYAQPITDSFETTGDVLKPAMLITAVEGLAPPGTSMAKAFMLFMVIVAVALAVGVFVGKHSSKPALPMGIS